MTPICPEACAYLDKTRLERQTRETESVFESPQLVDKRPWLAHAFTELLQVQRRGRIEPGIGDFRVSDDTLNAAGRVLGSITCRYLPSPAVFALSGGGIQITWANGPNAVEVSVFPGRDIEVGVARLSDDVPIKAVELRAAEYERVNEFLADFMGA
jgi:hypothetical protein